MARDRHLAVCAKRELAAQPGGIVVMPRMAASQLVPRLLVRAVLARGDQHERTVWELLASR